MLPVRRRLPLAGPAFMAALAALGVALLAFAQALRVGGWGALGWGFLAFGLLALAAALAPVSLALAATGWGGLSRRSLATLLPLCALGALVAGATALFGPPESYGFRTVAALVAGLDAWGVVTAVRLWRAP